MAKLSHRSGASRAVLPVAAAAVTAAVILPLLLRPKELSADQVLATAAALSTRGDAAFGEGKILEAKELSAQAGTLLSELALRDPENGALGAKIATTYATMTSSLLTQRREAEASAFSGQVLELALTIARVAPTNACNQLYQFAQGLEHAGFVREAFAVSSRLSALVPEYCGNGKDAKLSRWRDHAQVAVQLHCATLADKLEERGAAKSWYTNARNGAIQVLGPDGPTAKQCRTRLAELREAARVDQEHVVRKGDTFSSLAKQYYGDSALAELLREANPDTNSRTLKIGQRVKIPDPALTKDDVARREYERVPRFLNVEAADSLFSLAARSYRDAGAWSRLLAFNPTLRHDNLERFVGQAIRVRSEFGEPDPTPTTERIEVVLQRVIPLPTPTPALPPDSTRAAFIAELAPAAVEVERNFGIPAKVVIAQAVLETGWGARPLPGHNLFGIKASAGWSGASAASVTHEESAGRNVRTTAQFRAYDSRADSVRDYGRFLAQNPRYAGAFCTADPVCFAERIAAAGYATDSSYARKLGEIIGQYLQ